jgi:membrane protein implicated in regulation of membrane protease activity
MLQRTRFRAAVAGALTFAGVATYFLATLILRHMLGLQWLASVMTLAIPVVFAVQVYRRVRRGSPSTPIPERLPAWQRVMLYAGAAAYVLTGVAGSPRVQSDLSAWAVAERDRLDAGTDIVRPDGLPRVEVYVAVPILPGIVLAYYSYTIGSLYGLEAWGLYGWYGTGTKLLVEGVTGVA